MTMCRVALQRRGWSLIVAGLVSAAGCSGQSPAASAPPPAAATAPAATTAVGTIDAARSGVRCARRAGGRHREGGGRLQVHRRAAVEARRHALVQRRARQRRAFRHAGRQGDGAHRERRRQVDGAARFLHRTQRHGRGAGRIGVDGAALQPPDRPSQRRSLDDADGLEVRGQAVQQPERSRVRQRRVAVLHRPALRPARNRTTTPARKSSSTASTGLPTAACRRWCAT